MKPDNARITRLLKPSFDGFTINLIIPPENPATAKLIVCAAKIGGYARPEPQGFNEDHNSAEKNPITSPQTLPRTYPPKNIVAVINSKFGTEEKINPIETAHAIKIADNDKTSVLNFILKKLPFKSSLFILLLN